MLMMTATMPIMTVRMRMKEPATLRKLTIVPTTRRDMVTTAGRITNMPTPKLMRAARRKLVTTRPGHNSTPVTPNNANTITITAGMVATTAGMVTTMAVTAAKHPTKTDSLSYGGRIHLPPFSFRYSLCVLKTSW